MLNRQTTLGNKKRDGLGRPFLFPPRTMWRFLMAFVAYSHTMQVMLMPGPRTKTALWLALCAVVFSAPGLAQRAIYRCGNEYTNTVSDPVARGCKKIEGTTPTVVPPVRPPANSTTSSASRAAASSASPALAGQRVEAVEQRARDTDARQILNAELKKAETRQIELQREYNNGEPERRSDETRNYQKYLDRVAEIKANLARNDSDMASIRRELARQPGVPAANAGK